MLTPANSCPHVHIVDYIRARTAQELEILLVVLPRSSRGLQQHIVGVMACHFPLSRELATAYTQHCVEMLATALCRSHADEVIVSGGAHTKYPCKSHNSVLGMVKLTVSQPLWCKTSLTQTSVMHAVDA